MSFAIPNVQALAGVLFYVQAIELEAGLAAINSTNGLANTVGVR